MVADLLSYSAAAARMALSPSAVSQLVTELEAAVGFTLFDRTTRKVALSAAGREFLVAAGGTLRQVRLTEQTASDLRNRAAGLVRIAAPMVIAAAILPEAVRAFAALQPKVVVRIRDCAVEHLIDAVASGSVDLAIGPDRTADASIARTSLFESPWVLWCVPEHALAKKKTVLWEELRGHALVAAGHDHERSVSQMRAGLPDSERISPVDVVDNISTSLGIAATGMAATLSPAYVGILAERFNLVMRRIMEPEVMREVCIYRSATRAPPPAAQGFAEFLETWMGRWHLQQTRSQNKRRKARSD